MPEINIAASFKDGGMLRGLKDLRTVTKGFKGDLEGTSKKLEELSRQKIDIESKLNGARKAAKDFNNVIKQTKGAFGEGFLKEALKETHEYEAALQSVNAEIKNTQKEMRGLVSEENKRGNRSGGKFFDSTVLKKFAFLRIFVYNYKRGDTNEKDSGNFFMFCLVAHAVFGGCGRACDNNRY